MALRRSLHSHHDRQRDTAERLGEALRDSTAYVLGSVFRQVQRSVAQELGSEPGLSWAAFAILSVLDRPGSLGQDVIAERAGVDRTTVSRTLDDLEDDDLVRRGVDVRDTRRRNAAITAGGRSWLAEAQRYVAQGERQALRRLTKQERERLHVLLERALPSAWWSLFGDG